MTKSKTISDRTWQGRQSWNRQIIEDIGDKKVRFTVQVDSHDFQSWARAELWSGEKWNVIHSIPGQQVRACKTVCYVDRVCAPSKFDADITELRSVSKLVL